MPKLIHTISAPYNHELLFNLVADIEEYPNFLPWCEAARVNSKIDNVIIAELAIKYHFFRGSYSSKVILIPYSEIIVELDHGPFKHLSNNWKFIPLENNTQVDFTLDFQLKSSFLENIMSKELESYSHKLMDAFIKKAALIS